MKSQKNADLCGGNCFQCNVLTSYIENEGSFLCEECFNNIPEEQFEILNEQIRRENIEIIGETAELITETAQLREEIDRLQLELDKHKALSKIKL